MNTGLLPSMVALSRVFLLTKLYLNILPQDYSRRYLLTTPTSAKHWQVWALPFSLAATKGIKLRFLFLWVLRCFTSPGLPHAVSQRGNALLIRAGFPHSEIPGSKVASHLPEAYRRHATSFIASIFQGIHHPPVKIFDCPVKPKNYPACAELVINNHKIWVYIFSTVFDIKFLTNFPKQSFQSKIASKEATSKT